MKRLRAFLPLLVLTLGFLIVYACDTGSKCGPANCLEGCCDENDRCQSGLLQNACGVASQSCRSCETNELCQGGSCTPFGTPGKDGGTDAAQQECLKTCTGCCSSGTCHPGDVEAACGRGEACRTCSQGSSCSFGICIDPGCVGCTTSSGACELAGATTAAACGVGGIPCQSCPSGSTCQSGSCSACDGCRDGLGRCRGGATAAECGKGGASCVTCGTQQTCDQGTCQALCKSDGSQCLGAAECCSGACNSGLCGAALPPDGGCKSDGASCATGTECCGQSCTGGVCATPTVCGPSNCPGCCTSTGTCAAGTAASQCGVNGGQCLSCSGTTPSCKAGACVTGGGGTVSCGQVTNLCTAQPGPATPSNCDPCVELVCAQDSWCCTTGWDATCVGLVLNNCTGRCP